MRKKIKERKIIITASLIIPLGELAIYMLKPGEDKALLLDLLYKNPEQVNAKLKRLAREALREKKFNVRIRDLKFDYNDSDRFSHGASYFDVKLRGTEKELRKVAGENKIFFYDWNEQD